MRKIICVISMVFACMAIAQPTPARADIFAYPCQYPGVGMGAEIFGIGGQFCDYPTEINLSHFHCESGGARLGGVGLAGQQGISLGAISSLGASGEGCSWRCPDGSLSPAPNPPGVWQHEYIDVGKMRARNVFCASHLTPVGSTSVPVDPNEGLPDPTRPADDPINNPLPKPVPHDITPTPDPEGTVPIPSVPPLPAPIPAIPLPIP